MRTEQSSVPGDGLNGNDPVHHAGARPLSIKDATETAGRSVTQPPVIINFLTRDEQYVFSTFEVNDEETAEREAAAALEQGVPSYYLVPTGDRYHPWRRVDVGLSG